MSLLHLLRAAAGARPRRVFPHLALLGLLLAVIGPLRAEVTASVDATQVSQQDSIRLRLAVSGDANGGEPDITPLRQDFDILGSGRSSSINIVNGRVDSRSEWVITLAPKRGGELIIPALAVGRERTQPIAITVKARDDIAPGDRSQARDVFLESEVDEPRPLIQAQVTYTVRLFYQDVSDGRLADPELPYAMVRRLGQDLSYTTTRDNRRYRVLERRYALFPQASGSLTIPAPMFTGRVPDQSRSGRSPFDGFGAFDQFFQRTRPIRRHGEALTLEVLPRPGQAAEGPWLPAKSLTVSEVWSPDPPVLRAGEPITRSITLIARGLEGGQLPDIDPPRGDGLKLYPDTPVVETVVQGLHVMGRRTHEVVIVPTREGEVEFPPVQIQWWDTLSDRLRTAELPARRFMVQAGSLASAAAAAPPTAAQGASAAAPAGGLLPIGGVPQTPWPWLAAALLLAWVVTVFLWLREQHAKVAPDEPQAPAEQERPSGPREALARLRQACAQGGPEAARDALLDWARARWPGEPPHNLAALGARLPAEEARTALADLERTLYASGASPWQGGAFWRRVEPALRARPEAQAEEPEDVLPGLSPQV